jgi:hypothetical protein
VPPAPFASLVESILITAIPSLRAPVNHALTKTKTRKTLSS